ncbi:MAG: hypothetical protein ACO3SO_12025, partial [Luteolibacter sp.]
MYAKVFRGGKLLAISKGEKGGSRPIAVGDAARRIVARALSAVTSKALAGWCETTYENCVQFSSGTPVGAEKFLVSVLLALGGEAAPDVDPSQRDDDPLVVITLDTKNAFNTLDRQIFVDVLTNTLLRNRGPLTQDNLPHPPEIFKVHFPFIRAYYGDVGSLTFHAADGSFHVVESSTGVQQGCTLGGQLFNIGTLPLVGAAMASHPKCFAGMWADNIHVVGKLSEAYPAASDIGKALGTAGLQMQPRDSALYVPSYHAADQEPRILPQLRSQYPDMHLPWAKDGVRTLGFPLGNPGFVQRSLQSIAESIEKELPIIAQLDDGLVHFQVLSMCTNARLPFFLRGVSHDIARPFVQRIDDAIWKAFGDYANFPAGFEGMDAFRDAHIQFRLPIPAGGLGVAPGSVKAAAAFYVGMSLAFKFAAKARYEANGNLLRSSHFMESSLYKQYMAARDELRLHGAVSADEVRASQEDPAVGWDQKTPVLPLFSSLVVADTSELRLEDVAQTNLVPDQRRLTRLVHRNSEGLRLSDLTRIGENRACHMATRDFKARDQESQLNRAHKFRKDQVLKHSPLQFLASTSSLS